MRRSIVLRPDGRVLVRDLARRKFRELIRSPSSSTSSSRFSRSNSAVSVSACEITETYSPAAMDIAPATRPANPAIRMLWLVAPAAATPMITLAVETIPSFAPRTAAHSPYASCFVAFAVFDIHCWSSDDRITYEWNFDETFCRPHRSVVAIQTTSSRKPSSHVFPYASSRSFPLSSNLLATPGKLRSVNVTANPSSRTIGTHASMTRRVPPHGPAETPTRTPRPCARIPAAKYRARFSRSGITVIVFPVTDITSPSALTIASRHSESILYSWP